MDVSVLIVLRGVARALCELHAAGWAHGAVNTANVGLRHDGSSWLLPRGSLLLQAAERADVIGLYGPTARAWERQRAADVRAVGRLMRRMVMGEDLGETGTEADDEAAAELEYACKTPLTDDAEAMARERLATARITRSRSGLAAIAGFDGSRLTHLDVPEG